MAASSVGAANAAPAAQRALPSWHLVDTGSTSHFRALSAVSAKIAWVGGYDGVVLRTVDGGASWKDVSPAGASSLQFRDIQASDAWHAVAMAAGSGTDSRLYQTSNGGQSWKLAYTNHNAAAFFDCMSFYNADHGLVLSDPVNGKFRILSTRNGGRTWTVLPSAGMPQAGANEYGFAASGECLTTSGHDAWFGGGGAAVSRIFHLDQRRLHVASQQVADRQQRQRRRERPGLQDPQPRHRRRRRLLGPDRQRRRGRGVGLLRAVERGRSAALRLPLRGQLRAEHAVHRDRGRADRFGRHLRRRPPLDDVRHRQLRYRLVRTRRSLLGVRRPRPGCRSTRRLAWASGLGTMNSAREPTKSAREPMDIAPEPTGPPVTARIVVGRTLPEAALALLRDAGELRVPDGDRPLTPDELAHAGVGADALVSLLHDRIDDRLLDAVGGQLRIVANVAVGYDNIDVRACAARGVVVTNTPGVLVDATADLTLALLLGITRRVAEGDRLLRVGTPWSWSLDFMLGSGLHGKQLGIIGFGRIGQAVARRAAAFGMTIAFAGRHDASSAEWAGVATRMSLADLLGSLGRGVRALPVDRRYDPPDRSRGPAPDATDRVPDQHRARADRGRGGIG